MLTRQFLLKGLLFLSVLACTLFQVATIEPYATGDGIEYTLTTEALYRHGSASIRESDASDFKTAYISHKAWSENYKAAAFDTIHAFLKNSMAREYGGFYRTKNGQNFGYHFSFYSLINTPARWLTTILDINPQYTFQITNFFLLGITGFLLLFYFKLETWQSIGLVLLANFSAVFYYIAWSHPEIMTVVLVLLSLLFQREKKYVWSILLMTLASLQNQPLLILLIWLVISAGYNEKWRIKNWIRISYPAFLFFLPSAFYFYYFGTTNLIKDAGYLAVSNVTFTRFLGFFIDLNQGMILSLNLLLGVYIILLINRYRKVFTHQLKLCQDDFLPPLILLLTFIVCMMSNWNHGMAIVNRYAIWIGIIIVYHSIELLSDYGLKLKSSVICVVFALQFFFIKIHNPYNKFDWCNIDHLPFAKWALMNYPHLYNPDPQIFIARSSKTFDFSKSNSPVFYIKKENGKVKVLKVAVHEDDLTALMTYGLTLNQINNIKSQSSPIAHWYYINDIPALKKISLNQLKSIGAKKEIDRIKKAIYNSPQWINEITKKAKLKNISVEEQINADALYVYQNE